MAETSPSLLSLSVVLGANSTPVPVGPLLAQSPGTLATGELDSRFATLLAQSEGELLQQLQLGLSGEQLVIPKQLQELIAAQLGDAVGQSEDQAPLLLGDASELLAKLLGGKDLPSEQQDLPVLDAEQAMVSDDNSPLYLLGANLVDGKLARLESDVESGPSGTESVSAADVAQLLALLKGAAGGELNTTQSSPSAELQAVGLQGQPSAQQSGVVKSGIDTGIALEAGEKSKIVSADVLLANNTKAHALVSSGEQAGAAQTMLKPQQELVPETKGLSKVESLLDGLKSLSGNKLSLEAGTLEALAAKATNASDPKLLHPEMQHLATVPMNYRSALGSTVAAAQVQTSVFSPDWGGQVAEKLVWFSVNNIRTAELQLDPPDLGPLQVRINIQNDQTTIHFSSQHQAVREALDQSLPRLREIFVDNGLNLADVDVSDQSSQERQHALEQQTAGLGGEAGAEDGAEQQAGETSEQLASVTYSLNIVDAYA